MSAASLLKYCYLAYAAKPAAERRLYRIIRRQRAGRIVELGIGDTVRAQRMIAVSGRYRGQEEVSYTGIDLFEARPEEHSALSLKQAYKQLTPSGARLKLLPGDPYSALARSANSLLNTDLIIIGADQDADSLERAWFYVPRMLHGNSTVLIEHVGEQPEAERRYHQLPAEDIAQLAELAAPRRRAA